MKKPLSGTYPSCIRAGFVLRDDRLATKAGFEIVELKKRG